MKIHAGVVYFLLIVFLAGCATTPAVQPSPISPATQAPTLVPTPVPATPTPPPTAAPAPTATLEPTATLSSQVWLRGANMPTRRSSAAAAVLDVRIYVAGGAGPQGADETLAVLEVYDPATDTWEKRAPMPEGRFGPGTAALNGQIYVTGGLNIAEMGTNTWVYDPAADTWSALADMPGPRADHGMAALGGKLYVAGGRPEPKALWVYDPATDRWDNSTRPMTTDRPSAWLTLVAGDGKLYALGGGLAVVDIYDPATDGWTRANPLPGPRIGLTADFLNGRLHVTGGSGVGDTANTFYADHFAYDLAARRWETLPPIPSARIGLVSGVVDGHWYVMGGRNPGAGRSVTGQVDVYLP